VKYFREEDAVKARDGLSGRYYAGRPIDPELSPAQSFARARCRQFDQGRCNYGWICNMVHAVDLDAGLARFLDRR